MCLEPNLCNVCGLIGICTYEISRLGSEPYGEGKNSSWRPNANVKQQSVMTVHINSIELVTYYLFIQMN